MDAMECLCVSCGISFYLNVQGAAQEFFPGSEAKYLRDTFCTECGGPLTVVGIAGEEPFYKKG